MKPIPARRYLLEKKFLSRTPRSGICNPGDFDYVAWICRKFLQFQGIYNMGLDEARSLEVNRHDFCFPGLPEVFSEFRILFISDIHINVNPSVIDAIISRVYNLQWDICILGGDYGFYPKSCIDREGKALQRLCTVLGNNSPVLAVLGNNDEYDCGKFLDSLGVKVLINDSFCIRKKSQTICFAGVDDCEYYKSYDFYEACSDISKHDFMIITAHSPALYKEAEQYGFNLYLTGHTHGGQICLQGGIPVITRTNVNRSMVKGFWKYRNMLGFTSKGAGTNVLPIRINCTPEIHIFKLICKK